LVCLICLVHQDQLDEQHKPDEPVSPLHVAEMLFDFTGSVGNSVDERLVSWKMADAERPAALCLIRGHCGLSGAAPIFCDLTDQFPPFSLFVLPWRFCAEFPVVKDIPMWDATRKSLFIQSSARVPHETSAEGGLAGRGAG
jgi:hypothetical protein